VSDRGEVQVSGTVILDQIDLLKEMYGAAVVERARELLPRPLRAELDGLLRGGWCSTVAATTFKKTVADLVREEPLALQRKVVRVAIERTLNTVWRFLMRQISDERLVRRAPVLYGKSFNRGSLEFREWRPGVAIMELRGWPEIPEFDLVGLMTGIQTVLELGGRKEVHVEHSRKSDLVVIESRWRPKT
jgi:hypothetical protein